MEETLQKGSSSKILRSLSLLFIIGAVPIFSGILLSAITGYQIKNWMLTDAKIIEIEYEHVSVDDKNNHVIVTVEYFINDKKYVNNLYEYLAGMHVGQTVKIRYSNDNPNKIAYAESEFLVPGILFGLGAAFFIAGIIIFLILRQKEKIKQLKVSGKKITAVITFTGGYPVMVFCKQKDGNIVYKSKSRTGDFKIGDEIEVYESFDGTKYYVDIEGYMQKTKQSGILK